MKTAVIIARKFFSAAASLGFSLLLAVYISLFAMFMGAYELPVKLLLIGAVPLALILFYVRFFEKRAGIFSLALLSVMIMNAKKLLLFILALCMLCACSLTACTSGNTPDTTTAPVIENDPSQDDEMNMLAGTVGEYARSGSEVYLVYSTNGDALVSADSRWTEVRNVMEPQGVPAENIIFLGYGDSWRSKHIYDAEDNELMTSAAGFTETYSTETFEPYREGRAYTKKNFLEDLKAVILEIRADIIFCVDYDEHRTGYRPDGIFFSGQSFVTKLGAGISSFIQGIVFAVVGFSGDNIAHVNEVLANSPATDFLFATAPEFEAYRFGMFFLISVPTAISCVIAVLPMMKYELTNARHADILAQLNARRNEKSDG